MEPQLAALWGSGGRVEGAHQAELALWCTPTLSRAKTRWPPSGAFQGYSARSKANGASSHETGPRLWVVGRFSPRSRRLIGVNVDITSESMQSSSRRTASDALERAGPLKAGRGRHHRCHHHRQRAASLRQRRVPRGRRCLAGLRGASSPARSVNLGTDRRWTCSRPASSGNAGSRGRWEKGLVRRTARASRRRERRSQRW